MLYQIDFAGVFLGFVVVSALMLVLRWQSLRRLSLQGRLVWFLLWAYLPLLIFLTFFPLWFHFPVMLRPLRPLLPAMVPFHDLSAMLTVPGVIHYPAILLRNIGGNLFLLWPIGFLLPHVRPMSWRRALATGLLIALGLEGAQLVLALVGGTVRVVSSDDVLLNVTGALLGYGSFRAAGWLWRAALRARPGTGGEQRRQRASIKLPG